MVHTYDRMIRTAGRNQENDERPTTDSMTRILLLDEPTGRCHQNPFVGALSIYGPYTHLHTYAFSSPYAGTYTYIRLLLPSKYAFSWLLYIHTWRNVVGLWPMFDVLRAYVHTYIHTYICIQTHILQYVMCVHKLTCTHTHMCVCVRQPVLLLPHLAFRLGHMVIPDAFMPSCMRMCAFMGSLVVWHWSLLSLQLDGFVVIFSNLIKTRT